MSAFRRVRLARVAAALFVVAGVLVSGASAGRSAAPALGPWNGVVSFESKSSYASGDAKTVAHDARVYSLRGGASAKMTGYGDTLTVHSQGFGCGPSTEGWRWSGNGRVSAAITVDDREITLQFGVLEATYKHIYSGKINGALPCGSAVSPPPPSRGGTGSGTFGWNSHGSRSGLVRSAGSATVTMRAGGNPNPYATSGSISTPATIHVTWNLTRTGADKDHDGVTDTADPNPANPDTDGDGYPDGWELDHGTSPTNKKSHPTGPWSPGATDSDGDGYSDANEIGKGTDPGDKTSFPKGKADGGTIDPPKIHHGSPPKDIKQPQSPAHANPPACNVANLTLVSGKGEIVFPGEVLCQWPYPGLGYYVLADPVIQQKANGRWRDVGVRFPISVFGTVAVGVPFYGHAPCTPGSASTYRGRLRITSVGFTRVVTTPPQQVRCE